jgi:hypothetical protein
MQGYAGKDLRIAGVPRLNRVPMFESTATGSFQQKKITDKNK